MNRTTKFPPLNRHARLSNTSGIRAIANLVSKRSEQGLPVYPFHLGEPDFDTPAPIKEATIRALEAGEVHYPPNAGIPALREAIAASLSHRYGFPLHSEDVIVTVGACEALSLALMVCLEPGHEIVVPTPCWPNYLQTPELLGATVRQVPMSPSDGFGLDPDKILAAIGPQTRAVIVNTPNNPSGAVANVHALRVLLEGVRERGVWLIVDEIYHDLVFQSSEWHSVLEVASTDDPLIYVNGFSKSYAMTGWRLGYVIARGEVAHALHRVHQALVTSVTSFAQHGALAALNQQAATQSMLRVYTQRRERVLAALSAASFDTPAPAGGFYTFPKVPAGWTDDQAFTHDILTRYGIALVPGSVFGAAHTDRFRLCFACNDSVLDQGLTLLKQVASVEADLEEEV